MKLVQFFINCVTFHELCARMQFEVDCAKSHHRVISEALLTSPTWLLVAWYPALTQWFQNKPATARVPPATWLHVASYSGHNSLLMTNNLGVHSHLLQNILKPLLTPNKTVSVYTIKNNNFQILEIYFHQWPVKSPNKLFSPARDIITPGFMHLLQTLFYFGIETNLCSMLTRNNN